MNKFPLIFASIFLVASVVAEQPTFTMGPATQTHAGLINCGGKSRPSAVGEIQSEDGRVWVVPAENNYERAPKAEDLFNECGGKVLKSLADLNLSDVAVMDAGGEEEFIVYLFPDNYFELYVNGILVAVDPVVFTPFNSTVVRFKADRPLTIAIKMVDWEETLGLGMESNRGTKFHAGDGGLVAHFQDAKGRTVAITDDTWKAQTFYTSPIVNRGCLVVNNSLRDSSACDKQKVTDAKKTSAAHWTVAEDWMKPNFDDSAWPAAETFTNDTVGVKNKKAFMNFLDVFDAKRADAEFIWSSNLVLDNLVLLRKTVK